MENENLSVEVMLEGGDLYPVSASPAEGMKVESATVGDLLAVRVYVGEDLKLAACRVVAIALSKGVAWEWLDAKAAE